VGSVDLEGFGTRG